MMSDSTNMFRITNLKLKGLGSYIHSNSIDIQPITILCGTNGSGKSTWINVLSHIKRSVDKGLLPFNYEGKTRDAYLNYNLTNAHYHQAESPEDFPPVNKDATDTTKIGSICLKIKMELDYKQAIEGGVKINNLPNSPLSDFINKGKISKGQEIELSIALPQRNYDNSTLEKAIELTIGNSTLSFVIKPPREIPEDVIMRKERFKYSYDLTLTGADKPLDHRENLCDLEEKELSKFIAKNKLNKTASSCLNRLVKLTADALSGFFHIGAIREISDEDSDFSKKIKATELSNRVSTLTEFIKEKDLNQEESSCLEGTLRSTEDALNKINEEERMIQKRYVGDNGSKMHTLLDEYGLNEMKKGEAEYKFSSYYNCWLGHLLKIDYSPDSQAESSPASMDRKEANGFLTSFESRAFETQEEGSQFNESQGNNCRYVARTFKKTGVNAGPSNLSSGFHQIAPIIVQLGLMKKFEVCAIENPEVHLHPDLQIKLMEFLIEQARSGRIIIIETHSDLLVRRLLRAILENVTEEWTRIYFSSPPSEDADGVYSSTIERLETDDLGRVANWPAGFMDATVEEARKFMDKLCSGNDDDE